MCACRCVLVCVHVCRPDFLPKLQAQRGKLHSFQGGGPNRGALALLGSVQGGLPYWRALPYWAAYREACLTGEPCLTGLRTGGLLKRAAALPSAGH